MVTSGSSSINKQKHKVHNRKRADRRNHKKQLAAKLRAPGVRTNLTNHKKTRQRLRRKGVAVTGAAGAANVDWKRVAEGVVAKSAGVEEEA